VLLEVKHLSKDFRLRSGLLSRSTHLAAVKDVSFEVPASGQRRSWERRDLARRLSLA